MESKNDQNKIRLPEDSAVYLATLRTNPAFQKLLDDVKAYWAPDSVPEWTPHSPVSSKERIYYEARQSGFKLLISLIKR